LGLHQVSFGTIGAQDVARLISPAASSYLVRPTTRNLKCLERTLRWSAETANEMQAGHEPGAPHVRQNYRPGISWLASLSSWRSTWRSCSWKTSS